MKTTTERYALAHEIVRAARAQWPLGSFRVAGDEPAVETMPDRGRPDRVLVREDGLFFGGSSHHALNVLAAKIAGHELSERAVAAIRSRGEVLAHVATDTVRDGAS